MVVKAVVLTKSVAAELIGLVGDEAIVDGVAVEDIVAAVVARSLVERSREIVRSGAVVTRRKWALVRESTVVCAR